MSVNLHHGSYAGLDAGTVGPPPEADVIAAFSATTGRTMDGSGFLTSWAEKDARPGVSITPKTGTTGPTYSATGFNSTPGLVFNGGQILQLNGLNFSDYSDVVIMAAIQNTAAGTTMMFELSDNFNNGADTFVAFKDAGKFLTYVKIGGYNGFQHNTPAPDAALIATFEFCLSRTNTEETVIYLNGDATGTGLVGPDAFDKTFGNHVLYIGGRGSGGLNMTGAIAEIRIFGTELTTDERTARQNALATLTGITF